MAIIEQKRFPRRSSFGKFSNMSIRMIKVIELQA
jgi:hypothetical protein